MRERFDPTCRQENDVEPELVECIITTKVYDACRQTECEFFEFLAGEEINGEINLPEDWAGDIETLTGFAEIDKTTVDYEVKKVELIDGGPLARVKIRVFAEFDLTIIDEDTENEALNEGLLAEFYKDVVLWLPCPDRMEAIAEAIFCVPGEPIFEEAQINEEPAVSILVPVGAWIIIKSIAEVQLLIPAFGFCPTPPECEEFPDKDACEEFEELPFPDFYPPQPEPNDD
ncbi:hypothetical protein PRVXT_000556 [Proteinivorax tanatarense]|uniref:Uncharacterized protein n=1 Tax=Proteinivorax tanatarense TaxID=1260629 RepID=A0AAU7VNU6_9FIRM